MEKIRSFWPNSVQKVDKTLSMAFLNFSGEPAEGPNDLLPACHVQESPEVEGDSVQKVSGVQVRPG